MSYTRPYRDKLDLGIVKKSIVVDDVSKKKNVIWKSLCKQCFDLWMSVSLVVHFERHSVRTGSFQTGVVVLAAQH